MHILSPKALAVSFGLFIAGCATKPQQQPSDKALLDSVVTTETRSQAWNTNAQPNEIVYTDTLKNELGAINSVQTSWYLGEIEQEDVYVVADWWRDDTVPNKLGEAVNRMAYFKINPNTSLEDKSKLFDENKNSGQWPRTQFFENNIAADLNDKKISPQEKAFEKFKEFVVSKIKADTSKEQPYKKQPYIGLYKHLRQP